MTHTVQDLSLRLTIISNYRMSGQKITLWQKLWRWLD